MSKVIGFNKQFSNPPSCWPYVSAQLDCGHSANVVLKADRGYCWKCKHEQELEPAGVATTCAECAHKSFVVTFWPNPHKAEHIVSPALGDVVECEACASIARSFAWLEALDVPIHHARYREFGGGGSYYLYKLDQTSPSNFMLIGSVPALPAFDELLRRRRISPISPTEAA